MFVGAGGALLLVRSQSKPPVLTDREKLDYVSAQRMVDMMQPEWEKRTKARDAAGLAITKHCESVAGWIASLNPQTGEPECVEKPKDQSANAGASQPKSTPEKSAKTK
jgi:hypothetical protein